LQHRIEKRLEKKLPINLIKEPSVTLILEHVSTVNRELKKGQYFFSDVRKEGILLYDSGEYQLAETKELPLKDRKQIAKKNYNYWFNNGNEFLTHFNYALNDKSYSKAAFFLHQAAESFYNTVLLVFSGYKPKLHDILELAKRTRNYHYDLFKIFPYTTPEQVECFKLLRKAYIEARYDENYKISKKQLLYLISRLKKLKTVTEKICLAYINSEH